MTITSITPSFANAAFFRAKYKSSGNIHAKHDKKLLSKISNNQCEVKTTSSLATKSFASEKDESTTASRTRSLASVASTSSQGESKSVGAKRGETSTKPRMSNVCCEDPDDVAQAGRTAAMPVAVKKSEKKLVTKSSSNFNPPPPPEGSMSLNIGILTVSDRAAAGEYETGDLSGPAVEQSLAENVGKCNSNGIGEAQTTLSCNFSKQAVVPDDLGKIENLLSLWSGKSNGTSYCDIIFTTGGTGFSSRDVTPEATAKVIEKECKGLMAFVLAECSTVQPLAALSRGTAGVTGKTFIVNLPGNPEAVAPILNILFPLLLHAVKDIKRK